VQSDSSAQLGREAERLALLRFVPAYVICDGSLNVIKSFGDTAPYLVAPKLSSAGVACRVRPEWLPAMSHAVAQTGRRSSVISRTISSAAGFGEPREAHLVIVPLALPAIDGQWFAVHFQSLAARVGPWRRAISRLVHCTTAIASNLRGLRPPKRAHGTALRSPAGGSSPAMPPRQIETAFTPPVPSSADLADAIVRTMAEPLLVLDAHFVVERANPAYYETFRTSAAETLNRSLFSLGDGEWLVSPLRDVLEASPKAGGVGQCSLTHTFPAIGTRTLRINMMRLGSRADDGLLLILEDATRETVAEERLKTQERQRDEYLAMLAHELRNPLATTRAALEVWRNTEIDGAVQKRAEQVLSRQLDHQVRLTTQLLNVSRATRGMIELHVERFDLARLVHDLVQTRKAHSGVGQASLCAALPARPLWVEGDIARIEQIITNLLDNALKYTPAEGSIDLTLKSSGQNITLIVADNGIGITHDVLPWIFELFVQSPAALDRTAGGLGIGLALVRRLVELHGGQVTAASEGISRGSTFIVNLPIGLPVLEMDSANTELAPVAMQSSGLNVVLVEDNLDLADLSAVILQENGHHVRVAYDGASAVALVRESCPDVVLLDIGLPDIDGYRVAEVLRAAPESKNVLLIALTGYGGERDFERSKEAEFDHHVVKPADFDALEILMRAGRPHTSLDA
jgi:two-component system CheB/CheR fusion protein